MSPITQNTMQSEVKAATRWAMAQRDLREADRYLSLLASLDLQREGEESVATIKRALLSSAIVAYCRPFGSNKGAGIATKQICIDDFASVDVSLHKKLVDLRNKAVAHSDADVVPVQLLDHQHTNLLIVAELPFTLADEISVDDVLCHVDAVLCQILAKLHEYSDQLRAMPGALGPKIGITIGDIADGADTTTIQS
jgi:hypothetical protein